MGKPYSCWLTVYHCHTCHNTGHSWKHNPSPREPQRLKLRWSCNYNIYDWCTAVGQGVIRSGFCLFVGSVVRSSLCTLIFLNSKAVLWCFSLFFRWMIGSSSVTMFQLSRGMCNTLVLCHCCTYWYGIMCSTCCPAIECCQTLFTVCGQAAWAVWG
jgi:hypothetical protein